MRLFFVTSISKSSLSQHWVRPVCSSTPTSEVWTEFKKPQAPAALTETGEEHRGPRHFSSVARLPIPDLLAVRCAHPVSAPQKPEPFRGGGRGPHRLFAKVYVCERGAGSSVPEPSLLFAADSSRRAAASEGRHQQRVPQPAPQPRVGPRSPRLGRKGRDPGTGAARPAARAEGRFLPGPARSRVSGALPRVLRLVVSPAPAAMLDCAAAAAAAAAAAGGGLEEELGV